MRTYLNIKDQLFKLSSFFCLDTKESKNQGGESLVGGLFSNAAPFEWSITIMACNRQFSRYQMLPKRS